MAGVLLLILVYEALEGPIVVIVSTLIPLSLSLGLVWETFPAAGGAYLAFALAGFLTVPRRDWTTFDEMARRLGTVRDVLSRALRTLEQEGLLRVERSQIVLLDPDGLARRGET